MIESIKIEKTGVTLKELEEIRSSTKKTARSFEFV